ncbi:uncharacterized protein LOC127542055 isoform X3 [Antechinus flavipes]|uniref:uncharacterized protein LOC127542055 isoform X2 n=1 Tax=Antechinus flavipes TaxID=38775 RepID=UPI00223564D3|nr:uncharacterized protein LOC127542055 isoform X2 [Antechinus flavipes]XP_051823487.1 uncharacterized protein LOC127542055 isoform X3 [Antechinus flavipes]
MTRPARGSCLRLGLNPDLCLDVPITVRTTRGRGRARTSSGPSQPGPGLRQGNHPPGEGEGASGPGRHRAPAPWPSLPCLSLALLQVARMECCHMLAHVTGWQPESCGSLREDQESRPPPPAPKEGQSPPALPGDPSWGQEWGPSRRWRNRPAPGSRPEAPASAHELPGSERRSPSDSSPLSSSQLHKQLCSERAREAAGRGLPHLTKEETEAQKRKNPLLAADCHCTRCLHCSLVSEPTC